MKKTKEVSTLEYTQTVEFSPEDVAGILQAKAGAKRASQVIDFTRTLDGGAVVKLQFVKK